MENHATSAPTSTRWEPRRLALLRIEAVPFATTEALPLARVVDAAVEKVGIFGGRVEERGPTGLVAAFGLEIVEDAPRRAAHTRRDEDARGSFAPDVEAVDDPLQFWGFILAIVYLAAIRPKVIAAGG